jgi:hypothetical protein
MFNNEVSFNGAQTFCILKESREENRKARVLMCDPIWNIEKF